MIRALVMDTGVPSVRDGSADAVVEAATTAPTADTLVKRTAAGYVKDRADAVESILASYSRAIERYATPLGYTDLNFLARCQQWSGNLLHDKDSGVALTITGTPTPGYKFGGGYQGTYLDADGDAYSADVLDFASASFHVAHAFGVVTAGVARTLSGRWESGAGKGVLALLRANDKIDIPVNDGVLSGGSAVYVGDTAVVAGGIYLLQYHGRRDGLTPTLKGRLSKLGTGLLGGAESSVSLIGYGALGGAGGTSPAFRVGTGPFWGTGIVHLGLLVRLGAEVEGANKMSGLAAAAGFE